MGVLKTVFKFFTEKRIFIAQTADMEAMSNVVKFAGGNPFCVNSEMDLYFNGEIKKYKIIDFEIYPYLHEHQGDGSEYELEGKSHNYTCEVIIYIQEIPSPKIG